MNGDATKIKVCFIAPKAYPLFNPSVEAVFGGAEVDLYYLATELAKNKNFVVSFITADYGQQEIETIENVRVIKTVDFKKNPVGGAIKVWRGLHKADAQVYFREAVSWGAPLIALFCKLHKRLFIYRSASQRECDGTYLKEHFFAGRAFRWSLHNAAQVVVQNKTDIARIRQTMGVTATVIPNAHPLPVLSKSERDIILWVGRSTPLKRPGLFIDLAQKMPGEHFTMICQRATGDRNYQALTDRAGEVKNLQFIERVPFDEIDSYFLRTKVLVNTSYSEGFPNTFIQACKCGTPILSLKVDPDNFLNNFKCGICSNDNREKFVEHLRVLLRSQKAHEFGQNARRYAEQEHDIKKIIEEYKELFLELAVEYPVR